MEVCYLLNVRFRNCAQLFFNIPDGIDIVQDIPFPFKYINLQLCCAVSCTHCLRYFAAQQTKRSRLTGSISTSN